MYPLERITAPKWSADDVDKVPPPAWFTTPPNWNVTEEGVRATIQAYYASISFLDANVGRLLDALDRLGLAENTVVVFISDHGYLLGERGQWMKQMLFERSARAPLIVAGAGVGAKGQASRRIVEFLDVYPTLADLAGLKPPAGLHGRSLVPLLKDPRTAWNHPAVTQVRRGNAEAGFFMGYSVRTEQWRYVEWDDGKRGTELYDEAADPSELRNLAADPARASVVAELRRVLGSVRGK
jgi:uncharacterized sulfatase